MITIPAAGNEVRFKSYYPASDKLYLNEGVITHVHNDKYFDLEIDGKPFKFSTNYITSMEVLKDGDRRGYNVHIKDYIVKVENGEGVHCTCKGFQFRKQCRHLEEAIKHNPKVINNRVSTIVKRNTNMKPQSLDNLSWGEKLALVNHYQIPTEKAAELFNTTVEQVQHAIEQEQQGAISVVTTFNAAAYAEAVGHKQQKRRGRKGSKIENAFKAIPVEPIPAEQFASEHNVSLAVLRQSKRFDTVSEGTVHIRKVPTGKMDANDKKIKQLMIWRSAD